METPTFSFQPISTFPIDLSVQWSDFNSTEFDIAVVSDKARYTLGGIVSFTVAKSQLPVFAEQMLREHGLMVG